MHYRFPHPGQGILGPAPAIYASHPTTLPSALSTMPLQDPTWHMNTGLFNSSYPPSITWLLVPRPAGVNMVYFMWLFKHKFHADGTLSRYKACLVANGSSQQLDDIILTASFPALLQQILGFLNNEFDMTDPGAFNYFFGIYVDRTPTGLFLSHKKYALQLLDLAHMVTCNPSRTPVDTESKLSPKVQQICLYMHDMREPYLVVLKRILRYFQGTLNLGLHLYASSTTSLVAYTDADWAGCPRSAEAEYSSVANVVTKTAWLRNLLRELHSPLSTTTLVYCDNVSAVYMYANTVQHQRTKHIEIDIHFVQDMVTVGQVRVLHMPSRF
nr:hypothetical protein [Tanacetum cinerariifolium]